MKKRMWCMKTAVFQFHCDVNKKRDIFSVTRYDTQRDFAAIQAWVTKYQQVSVSFFLSIPSTRICCEPSYDYQLVAILSILSQYSFHANLLLFCSGSNDVVLILQPCKPLPPQTADLHSLQVVWQFSKTVR